MVLERVRRHSLSLIRCYTSGHESGNGRRRVEPRLSAGTRRSCEGRNGSTAARPRRFHARWYACCLNLWRGSNVLYEHTSARIVAFYRQTSCETTRTAERSRCNWHAERQTPMRAIEPTSRIREVANGRRDGRRRRYALGGDLHRVHRYECGAHVKELSGRGRGIQLNELPNNVRRYLTTISVL